MSADDYYAPNQQVVREDGSGPAEEGSGGEGSTDPAPPSSDDTDELELMTKAELVDEAAARGVEVDTSMTKAEIADAIRAG